ncbi:MAG: carboxypeptidase-like regulatory domain-containing protein [Myxococcota bacterium]
MGISVIALGWLACGAPETVELSGLVYASHDPLSGPLPDARLAVVDEYGEALAEATTGADGAFTLIVPEGRSVFVEIAADGFTTSTFPGVVGLEDVQQVEDHALYGVSDAEHAGWIDRLGGCTGADDPEGALVIGEVRVYGITDPLTGGNPSVGTAQVEVADGDTVWSGCYLDADGIAWDPDADYTGATGLFAVPGVGRGLLDLRVSADIAVGATTTEVYPLWIPADGVVVAPWYPAYVELF